MVDATADIVREADRAATDAAIEAREEILQRNEIDASEITAPTRSKRRANTISKQSTSKQGWKHFIVDIWFWDLNPTEFGIFKRSRNRAKSRQFTQDMDIYAEIIEDGKRTGLVGYRKQLWQTPGPDRRLVFKLFSDKLNWHATMDLMLARSVQQTLGARLLPVMSYCINTARDSQAVYIERSANKWPLLPENFSFFLLKDGKPEFFRLRRNIFCLGDDYTIYDKNDKKIGLIDGAFFTINGRWRVRVKEEYADRQFLNVLKMFTSMLIFNSRCRSYIKQLARHVRSGEVEPKLDRQEADLYLNPRRIR